jgi:hypothetical protein
VGQAGREHIETGKALLDAREELEHGSFESMVNLKELLAC